MFLRAPIEESTSESDLSVIKRKSDGQCTTINDKVDDKKIVRLSFAKTT